MAEPEPTPFWQRLSLAEMSPAEWESLCDGCGRCCLVKLEDADSSEIDYTDVACRLLDQQACRCKHYSKRTAIVDDCTVLTAAAVPSLSWLPPTCAYRLVDEGCDLYWWHPLVSGDPATVHAAGISVRGRTVSEIDAGDYEDHIVTWPTDGGV